MEKYFIGDDSSRNKKTEPLKDDKITLEKLKEKVTCMEIYADVVVKSPYRATVTVHKNIGTTMFMSAEFDDHFWLQNNCIKREDTGGVIKYHFVLD